MVHAFIRFALLLSSLFLSSLSFAGGYITQPLVHAHSYDKSYSSTYGNGPYQNFTNFNALDISGQINVILKNARFNTIEFLDNSQQYVNFSLKGNTLNVGRAPIPRDQRNKVIPTPTIIIGVARLNKLTTHDYVIVQGNLNSSALNINSEGYSQISLKGMMNVQKVNTEDNAQVKLYWINSSNLVLNGSDRSSIQLAGVAGVLHASLSDSAQLHGQYLRAQQAVIQTDNSAFAGIEATQALRAFASDDSNILYYKYPRAYNDFSTQSGNILQIDWRP
ncbi:MAG TPA: DUF2807 domain-containing protein [Coxiellaceae bacterium]|nr:DUF2807 domain-containing protein [Coxiellaceae bacterium]